MSDVEIVILTSSELRHDFVRTAFGLADGITVCKTYREGLSGTALESARKSSSDVQIDHLERRARSEHDFFDPFVSLAKDRSNPVDIPRGDINTEACFREITDIDPDLLVAYGCSIIEDPLLSAYEGRFLNVHLGLSPYYRGAGTNFWPLVDGAPEYVGATFMHLDEGIDTGDIIHQIRARVHPGDSPHTIGNRMISDMTRAYISLVRRFKELEPVPELPEPSETHYYRSEDFSETATRQLYRNFEEGLVETYLNERNERVADVPIVTNPALEDEGIVAESWI